MIKFFRKIRQNLLSEGKTGKPASRTGRYLKYAIGEVILVVIGILIALQINNWNEERKAKIFEKELYGRILVDLQIDENRINEHIVYYNKDQEILNNIYQETQRFSTNDSITEFSTIRAARIFDLILTVNYSHLTKDIKMPQILDNIDHYFREEQHVKDAFNMMAEFKEEHLKPYLAKHGINDAKELFNNHQLSYYELREKNVFSYSKLKEQYGTVELEQMLFDLGIRTSWAKTALEDLLKTNKNLQLDLTNVLKTNKPSN
ncbi:hypothetical protein [Psychroserpens sp. SPM9]|uniref:hypothetical protein n=1 Tax=Psychroserpens sp. SPM9 TaxID=2975598 RepID=UPI0021A27284|nr:hypothetical protein [Psychroserpens sp. SPM9]MDG5493027.1 hypothetical protein [Psychroserpens sp. SPM9]